MCKSKSFVIILCLIAGLPICILAQSTNNSQVSSYKTTELVMSMSQRSLVMPGYLTELKALIARQAYEFWKRGNIEPYVSHLNVYSALHRANKFLDYDSARGLFYNQVGFHSKKVTSIQFGSDPDHYYSTSADGSIYKWSLNEPGTIPETIYQSNNIIKSADISGDGKWMLVVFYQTGIALVSLDKEATGDLPAFLDPEPVRTAVFVPHDLQYLSVSMNGELKLKDLRSGTRQVGKTDLTIKSLEVDKNDGTIYGGTSEGVLQSWAKPYEIDSGTVHDIKKAWTQQSYFGYELGTFAINCMDISPNGKQMAIGRERGDVILWDIERNQLNRIISSHQSAITDISFSPDNELLLTTSRDRTARLWDLNDSRKLPVIFDDHGDWVLTGCFDPAGKQVITGSSDVFLRTWPVDPQVLADRICSLISRNLTREEWIEFVGPDIPYETTCAN
ncbi:MAG: hypothetical protein RIM99_10120 [Cyclobacteriaceae bacterium]